MKRSNRLGSHKHSQQRHQILHSHFNLSVIKLTIKLETPKVSITKQITSFQHSLHARSSSLSLLVNNDSCSFIHFPIGVETHNNEMKTLKLAKNAFHTRRAREHFSLARGLPVGAVHSPPYCSSWCGSRSMQTKVQTKRWQTSGARMNERRIPL